MSISFSGNGLFQNISSSTTAFEYLGLHAELLNMRPICSTPVGFTGSHGATTLSLEVSMPFM